MQKITEKDIEKEIVLVGEEIEVSLNTLDIILNSNIWNCEELAFILGVLEGNRDGLKRLISALSRIVATRMAKEE